MDDMTGFGRRVNRVRCDWAQGQARLSLFVAFLLFLGSHAAGDGAPKVKLLVPKNGAANVPVATKEIVVTFDRPMSTNGFSFVGGGPSFPKTSGRPFWKSETECVLPVTLEPHKEYRLGLNSASFQHFRSQDGIPLGPVIYQFTTGKAEMNGDASDSPVKALQAAIRNHYSYRDMRGLDWDALWKNYGPRLDSAKDAADFAATAAELLAMTKDPHIWFDVGGKTIAGFRRNVQPNGNFRDLPSVVDGFDRKNKMLAVGIVGGDFAYLAILSLAGTNGAPELEPAFSAIEEASSQTGVILDLRFNAGGNELLGREIAGCFLKERKLYAKHANPGVEERWVGPNSGRPTYRGKVAVLSGPYVMSSAEGFLLMLKQVPDAKVFGAHSYGSSGNPKPHDLGNGVTVFLPSWKAMLPDGTVFEGVGIAPDIEVPASNNDFTQGKDPVIDAAVTWLRE